MSLFNKLFGGKQSSATKSNSIVKPTPQVPAEPLDNKAKFELLSQKSAEYYNQGDFGLYRNARYSMAEICYKEGNYRPAVNLFCEVSYCDMSHLFNQNAFWLESGNNALKVVSLEYMYKSYKGDSWVVFCAPACRNRLITLQKKMNLDDKDFFQMIKEDMSYFTAPFHPLTNEECAKLLISLIRDPEKPYKTAFVNGRHRILEAIKQYKD